MTNISIKVKDVSKIYKLYDKQMDRLKEALGKRKEYHKKHYALSDMNFEIKKGETVGIIGKNGSGKSTILKIITGVLKQTTGDVFISGRISALLELGAGFNMEYTGIENIYLNGTMIGFTRQEIDERLDDIISFADIGEFINQPVKTYSSGMFVRLAFAVAINIDPEILIVDEALSVGDVFFQSKCFRKFEDFKKLGKTILMVSHDLSSIAKYCDKVILLDGGKKVAEGKPKEIIDMYKKILVNQLDTGKENRPKVENKAIEGKWSNSLIVNPDKVEYGSKLAEIIDFAIIDEYDNITNSIMKYSEFKVKMKVRFAEDIEEPIFAFTIKDLKGTEITGTNTMLEKINISVIKAGDIKEITFTQKMNLQGGEYLMALGCTGFRNGEFTVYHRLYDICNISVISHKNTVGYYDMGCMVEVL
ncbi:MAG: transporter related protein [Clostridiaceae bacterium]|jgi:teichoic acid transport system ATP-binding protein|nr:transporter related protein [Clostridiaceae bacterium]